MAERIRFHGPRPGRVLGLYALATMSKEGPVYGYQLAERIAERTDGAWHPGAGAIYPALTSLARKGYARAAPGRGRRMYSITPRGRAFLARVRSQWMGGRGSGPDLSRLWAEISGAGDPGEHLLRHLHRHLDSIVTLLDQDPDMRAGSGNFRALVREELRVADERLAPPGGGRSKAPRTRGGRT
ncbi:MAG TPA: PadR family transcriptional regulator [Thermoplasmata archaeon]|jgi:DNA-binding PadR family transcriptional regulator|nr:PadR family transcriptional regulator [Thermoplasmata archaeon]